MLTVRKILKYNCTRLNLKEKTTENIWKHKVDYLNKWERFLKSSVNFVKCPYILEALHMYLQAETYRDAHTIHKTETCLQMYTHTMRNIFTHTLGPACYTCAHSH